MYRSKIRSNEWIFNFWNEYNTCKIDTTIESTIIQKFKYNKGYLIPYNVLIRVVKTQVEAIWPQ